VLLNSGERAIVKELKPFDDMTDELRGAHYLSWRDGMGAVRLDLEGSSMLPTMPMIETSSANSPLQSRSNACGSSSNSAALHEDT
jgi:streptomycin 6-kinase